MTRNSAMQMIQRARALGLNVTPFDLPKPVQQSLRKAGKATQEGEILMFGFEAGFIHGLMQAFDISEDDLS